MPSQPARRLRWLSQAQMPSAPCTAADSPLLTQLLQTEPLLELELDGGPHFLSQHATSAWDAACAVFTAVQVRADEMDAAAAARGARLLTCLDRQPLQLAMEHVLEAIGGSASATAAKAGVAQGVVAQHLALTQLLEACTASPLLQVCASAAAAQAERHGSAYEDVCPTVLSAAPVAEAVREARLPMALQRSLATCPDAKLRLRAIACAANVWASTTARWAEALEGTSRNADARALALSLVNVVVDSALYDPVAKVRLAATRLVHTLSQRDRLKPDEVLKLGLLKARDKAEEVRVAAFKLCAQAVRSGDDEEGAASGSAPALSASDVQQIVLHGCEPGMGDEPRRFAADVLLNYLAAQQADIAPALAALKVCDQLDLYVPLLAPHADKLMAAAFPDGLCDVGVGGAAAAPGASAWAAAPALVHAVEPPGWLLAGAPDAQDVELEDEIDEDDGSVDEIVDDDL